MTVGMQQQQIAQLVASALVPLDNMVNVPPAFERNQLLAHRAALALAKPQLQRLPLPLVRASPRIFQPLLEVHLVLWGVWVSLRLDLGVPLDRRIAGVQQVEQFAAGV